jgi:hypothetical protein
VAVNYYEYPDEVSRRICIQLYRNKEWTLPPALINSVGNPRSAEEMTLFQAVEYVKADPELKKLKDPKRRRVACS